jgi:hypothetical protein
MNPQIRANKQVEMRIVNTNRSFCLAIKNYLQVGWEVKINEQQLKRMNGTPQEFAACKSYATRARQDRMLRAFSLNIEEHALCEVGASAHSGP